MPSSGHDAFAERLAWAAVQVEASLSAILDEEIEAGETYRPPRLAAAMRHAALTGGKRFRPFLVIETARLFGVETTNAVLAAAAVECVHSYSLVHDDLPAMDDDDFRRGAPTVHKAFDEATAILAGDALLTLAFDILSRPQVHGDAGVRIELTMTLARAAGVGGMAGGQMLDLEAEGATLDEAAIRRLQAMKTGALIAASCEMGAVLGGAQPEDRAAIRDYGGTLGLAFQLADDLLDVEASADELGKATAKDAGRGKATLVALLGPAKARCRLAAAAAKCERHLARFGPAASTLAAAARFAAERRR